MNRHPRSEPITNAYRNRHSSDRKSKPNLRSDLHKYSGIVSLLLVVLALVLSPGAYAQSVGQSTYSGNCLACHSNGVGPQIGDTNVWQSAFDREGSAGLESLVRSGPGTMPAFPSLSNSAVEAVVQYILDQSDVDTTPTPTNFPPNIQGVSPSRTLDLTVDQQTTISVQFTDENPASVTYEVVGPSFPALLSVVSLNNGSFRLTPGRQGSGSFTITVTDNANQTDSVQVFFDNTPAPVAVTPTLSIAQTSITVTEGGTVTVPVRRTGDTTQSSSVRVSLVDGTATSGSDYTRGGGRPANDMSGVFEFDPGQTEASLPFVANVTDDDEVEFSETFQIVFSDPVDLEIDGPDRVNITIDDNDISVATPTLSIEQLSIAVTEGGTVTVPVRRTGDTSQESSVRVSLVSGTAVAGSDYTRGGDRPADDLNGIIRLDPGQSEALSPFVVNTTDDSDVESPETFQVVFSDPVNLQINGSDTINITINDNDDAVVTPTPTLTLSLGVSGVQTLNVGDTLSFIPEVTSNQSTVAAGYQQTLSASANPSGIVRATSPGNDGSILVETLRAGRTLVTVVASDSLGATASASFNVEVVAVIVNQAPEARDDTFIVNASVSAGSGESQLFDILANDIDLDGDNLRIILDSASSDLGATLTSEGSRVRYRPNSEITGTDRFRYRVADDSNAESPAATVTVQLSDIDGDGRGDAFDNCPLSPNANQLDTDSDGAGDVCDSTPNGQTSQAVSTIVGQEIAQAACLACHAEGLLNAPISGNVDTWNQRFDAVGGLDGLVQNSLTGVVAMPAYAGQYTAAELGDAILFLSGRREGTSFDNNNNGQGPAPIDGDIDADDIVDANDNCPTLPNNDQRDTDSDGIGDVCDDDADNDADGLPFSIDDDDSNARRLPGSATSQNGIFVDSTNTLQLGPVALAYSRSTGFSNGGVQLSISDFANTVASVFGMAPQSDNVPVSGLTNPIDIVALGVSNEVQMVYSTGGIGLPLSPVLQAYSPATGQWTKFESVGFDSLARATTSQVNCPAASSANYITQLQPGFNCIRITVSDGGPNDRDGTRDGSVSLTFRIISAPSDDGSNPGNSGNVPETIVLNPSSGGGGSMSLQGLLLMLVVGVWFNLGRRGRLNAQ